MATKLHPINAKNGQEKKDFVKKGGLSKKELRERKRERRSKRSHGQMRNEVNQSFGQLKIADRPRREQYKLVESMIEKMKGNIYNIVRALDSTRAIQTAIKYGTKQQVLSIAKELKGHYIGLATDLYAHNTVKRLLEFCCVLLCFYFWCHVVYLSDLKGKLAVFCFCFCFCCCADMERVKFVK